MAFDLSTITGGHAGSWNVGIPNTPFQVTLPDYGATEKITDSMGLARNDQGGSNLQQSYNDVNQLNKNLNTIKNLVYPNGQVQGASTTAPTNTQAPTNTNNSNSGPAAPQDSRLTQLQKMAQGGALNPAQQTELNSLLSAQAMAWAQDPANQINGAYGETDSLLNGMQNRLQAGQQDFYNTYTGQYDAMMPTLTANNQNAQAQLAAQQDTAKFNEANVINSARKLYNEMQTGYRQKFGGGNSASDFAGGILGRELMRNIGTAQNNTGQTIKTLQDKSLELNNTYAAQVKELNMQKENALMKAKSDFQDKLNQIDSMRIQNAQGKAQAKLAALQELRQRAYQVQDQVTAYQQQLDAMKQQADLQLRNSLNQYNKAATDPVQGGPATNITYSAPGAQQQSQGMTVYGSVNPLGKKINDITGMYGPQY